MWITGRSGPRLSAAVVRAVGGLAVVVFALGLAFALCSLTGCAAPAEHKVSPASSRVIDAWVDQELGDIQTELDRVSAELERLRSEREIADPGPAETPTPTPEPSTHKTAPAGVSVIDLSAWFVACAVGAQPAERPETSRDTQPGVRLRPDGSIELGPGGHLRLSEGRGSGLETTAGELANNWRAEAPTAAAGDLAASGGGLRHVMEATGVKTEPAAVLLVIGGLALVGGAVAFLTVSRKLGAGIAAGGAMVLAAAWLLSSPALMFALCGLGLLVVAGVVLWHGRAARADALALSAVTSSVQRRAAGDKPAIFEGVKQAAGAQRPAVDRAIARAKRRAGVLS